MVRRLGHLPALKPWLPAAVLVVTGALALRNLVGVVHFALHRAFEGDFAVYYIFARVGIDHGWGSLYDYAAMRQEWLALVDIKASARDVTIAQCRNQRRFVHDRATRGIDQVSGRLH